MNELETLLAEALDQISLYVVPDTHKVDVARGARDLLATPAGQRLRAVYEAALERQEALEAALRDIKARAEAMKIGNAAGGAVSEQADWMAEGMTLVVMMVAAKVDHALLDAQPVEP